MLQWLILVPFGSEPIYLSTVHAAEERPGKAAEKTGGAGGSWSSNGMEDSVLTKGL